MNIKIRSILLWPRDTSKSVRRIDFIPDKINVITGQSQTGKSAIIPIIDYCLGSNKCAIPVDTIREKTEWFGLLLETTSSQILLARQEPGEQVQTSDMYMDESQKIEIPNRPQRTCNTTLAKIRLNELSKLPSLSFDGGEKISSFKNPPSIRDMAAFEFQPQYIIANPYTLFFKADTYEHQQKLRTIFPFVLDAIDVNSLRLIHELKELQRELKDKQNELNIRKETANSWKSSLKELYSQAKELNLLPKSPDPVMVSSQWHIENYITHLKSITTNISEIKIPSLSGYNTQGAIDELMDLKRQEESVVYAIDFYRSKLLKMEELMDSGRNYKDAILVQQERLGTVDWFSKSMQEKKSCPFCGSKNELALSELKDLVKITNELLNSSRSIEYSYPILDKEVMKIKKELRMLENSLSDLRIQREKLEEDRERQKLSEVYRYIGRLEESLNNLSRVEIGGDLSLQIDKLKSQIKANESAHDSAQEEKKKNIALSTISGYISEYAKILDLERADDQVSLDISNLTIKISSPKGQREDFLWEIGSGSNWMGYHLATLLALHEYFISLNFSHVPQFLVLDQPSQVYFPERWPEDPDPRNPHAAPKEINSEDLRRTKDIFKCLSEALSRTNKQLQIIVIEHADEIAWQEIDNMHLVERWRGDKFLIPPDW